MAANVREATEDLRHLTHINNELAEVNMYLSVEFAQEMSGDKECTNQDQNMKWWSVDTKFGESWFWQKQILVLVSFSDFHIRKRIYKTSSPPSLAEMRGVFWKLRLPFLNVIYWTIIWIILRLTIDYYVTTSHSVKLMDTIFERLLLANRLLSKPRMSVKPNRNYGLWLSLLPWKNVPVFWCSIWKSLIRFIFVHIWNVLGVEMVINWETWYLQNMGLRLL